MTNQQQEPAGQTARELRERLEAGDPSMKSLEPTGLSLRSLSASTNEEWLTARNEAAIRKVLGCAADVPIPQCALLTEQRLNPEQQEKIRQSWQCDTDDSLEACANRMLEAASPRALFRCNEYEPFEDCKIRYREENKARFMTEWCNAGETFETCQKRTMTEGSAQAKGPASPQIRLQLGCYDNESLEQCRDRVSAEVLPQYLDWLAEQGLDPEEVFAVPSEEENRLRVQMGNMPLLNSPDVTAIAVRWHMCKRVEEGEAPPSRQQAVFSMGSNFGTRPVEPCEGAFDPYHWKTLPPMNR